MLRLMLSSAAFFPENSGSGPNNTKKLELVGAANVKDADVIIVDDMIDTAGTLSDISLYLQSQGARNVYVSARTVFLMNQHWN